jgi:multiple sugar transport system permease protein
VQRVRGLVRHRTYNEYIWAYIFLAPAMLAFVLFLAYPALQSLIFSFQKFSIFQLERPFVGIKNYQTLFKDRVWWIAVKNTIMYTAATVPFSVMVSLLIALTLMRLSSTLQTIFKTVFYMPGVTSAVVIGLVWLWIYYPFAEGLGNFVVTTLGVGRQNWLGSGKTALPSIIFMNWMTGQGATIILYMAALGGIPKSIYDAAKVDCASGWTTFWRVTWPLIKPTTLFAAITGTAGSFLVFDTVYTMTRGGPGTATVTMVYKTYITAFQDFQFGLSSAMAVFLAVLVIGFNVLQFKFLATDVEY